MSFPTAQPTSMPTGLTSPQKVAQDFGAVVSGRRLLVLSLVAITISFLMSFWLVFGR